MDALVVKTLESRPLSYVLLMNLIFEKPRRRSLPRRNIKIGKYNNK